MYGYRYMFLYGCMYGYERHEMHEQVGANKRAATEAAPRCRHPRPPLLPPPHTRLHQAMPQWPAPLATLPASALKTCIHAGVHPPAPAPWRLLVVPGQPYRPASETPTSHRCWRATTSASESRARAIAALHARARAVLLLPLLLAWGAEAAGRRRRRRAWGRVSGRRRRRAAGAFCGWWCAMQAGRRARAVVAGRRGSRQRVLLRQVVVALKYRWYVSLVLRHLCHYALNMLWLRHSQRACGLLLPAAACGRGGALMPQQYGNKQDDDAAASARGNV